MSSSLPRLLEVLDLYKATSDGKHFDALQQDILQGKNLSGLTPLLEKLLLEPPCCRELALAENILGDVLGSAVYEHIDYEYLLNKTKDAISSAGEEKDVKRIAWLADAFYTLLYGICSMDHPPKIDFEHAFNDEKFLSSLLQLLEAKLYHDARKLWELFAGIPQILDKLLRAHRPSSSAKKEYKKFLVHLVEDIGANFVSYEVKDTENDWQTLEETKPFWSDEQYTQSLVHLARTLAQC